jgi:peptidoglycan lytic transglycosylase
MSLGLKLLLVIVLSGSAAVIYLMARSKDPIYVVRELKNWTDYRRFDPLIVKAAHAHRVDPRLVKAIVWRESRFQADMLGRDGERGLMQVTEMAARDWALANNVKNFHPDQLLVPEVNLEVGSWYLGKAVQRWQTLLTAAIADSSLPEQALPFALAEYNAGKSRVDRWIRVTMEKHQGAVTAEHFQDNIDYPSTARYVRTILARYDFYRRRGEMK